MHDDFFGFRERPFPFAPATRLYFPAEPTEHARQTLIRTVERCEGAGLLLGPTGSGKSLVCQLLAEHFRGRFLVAALASARLCTRKALLQNILFELDLPYRGLEEGELRLSLIDHLDAGHTNPPLLLLVDEAHSLPIRLLEEIRMITNLVRDGEPRVRLILSGGPHLEERLANPKLESLQQRISARCYLQPLNHHETCSFVRHQIETVGGSPDEVLAADAYDAVFRASDGVPRLVNQVMDHALMLSQAGGVKPIHAGGIEEAWSDLQQLPTPWNRTEPLESTIEFGELGDDDVSLGELDDDEFEPVASVFGGEDDGPADQVELRLLSVSAEASDSDADLDDADLDVDSDQPSLAPLAPLTPRVSSEPLLPVLVEADPFAEPFDDEEIVIDQFADADEETGSQLTWATGQLTTHAPQFPERAFHDHLQQREERAAKQHAGFPSSSTTEATELDDAVTLDDLAELTAGHTDRGSLVSGLLDPPLADHETPVVVPLLAEGTSEDVTARPPESGDFGPSEEIAAATQALNRQAEHVEMIVAADAVDGEQFATTDPPQPVEEPRPERTAALGPPALGPPALAPRRESADEETPLTGDHDILVVEDGDDEATEIRGPRPGSGAVRIEYRKLFAQLRRG